MNEQQVSDFERLQAQLHGLYEEMGLLSRKKPDDAVNKFKLRLINKILEQANELLQEQYRPFNDFEKFDEDDMPTNSDSVLILSQYFNCLEKLRADNIILNPRGGGWVWKIDSEPSNIRTAPPKKLEY